MNRHIRTLLTGAAVVIPSVITLYVIWWIGLKLDSLGRALLESGGRHMVPGVGAVIVLLVVVLGIYLAGLLARLVVFRSLLAWWERLLARVPGVRTVYESVRDMMNLLGGGSGGMGKAVEYRPPGADYIILGVVTNRALAGTSAEKDDHLVSVYLPFTYMIGGVTVLADRRNLKELDMSVERAMKLAATAHVESGAPPAAAVKAALIDAPFMADPTPAVPPAKSPSAGTDDPA